MNGIKSELEIYLEEREINKYKKINKGINMLKIFEKK